MGNIRGLATGALLFTLALSGCGEGQDTHETASTSTAGIANLEAQLEAAEQRADDADKRADEAEARVAEMQAHVEGQTSSAANPTDAERGAAQTFMSPASDLIAGIYPECAAEGYSCENPIHLTFAVAGEQLTAYGVNLRGDGGVAEGTGVAVFNADQTLRWSTPLEFYAGYGLTALASDLAGDGHLFVRYAITNHTPGAWVVDLSQTPARTFGRAGDGTMFLNDYSEPVGGVRKLYVERHNWIEHRDGPDEPSHDVYIWDEEADDYVYDGCVNRGFSGSAPGVPERIPVGEPPCEAPKQESSTS